MSYHAVATCAGTSRGRSTSGVATAGLRANVRASGRCSGDRRRWRRWGRAGAPRFADRLFNARRVPKLLDLKGKVVAVLGRPGTALGEAVELRLGEIRAGHLQDLVGLAQLANLAFELLDALLLGWQRSTNSFRCRPRPGLDPIAPAGRNLRVSSGLLQSVASSASRFSSLLLATPPRCS